jgi:hypothetical protein
MSDLDHSVSFYVAATVASVYELQVFASALAKTDGLH